MTVVDAHNLLFRTLAGEPADIVRAQEDLVRRVREAAARRGREVIMVFDGTGGAGPHGREERHPDGVRVVYPGSGLSADDWIAAWLARAPGTGHVLVTDDLGLRERARRPGLAFADGPEWLARETRRPRREGQKREFGSVDYWLKEFGS